MIECTQLLEEKAEKFGLTNDGELKIKNFKNKK